MLDIIVCIFLLVIGFNYKNRFKEFSDSDRKFVTNLFFYHILFGIAYYFYVGSNAADANIYWGYPKKYVLKDIFIFVRNGDATKNVMVLNYIPARLMDLSFFTGSMLYAFVGYIGWVFFYRIVKENVPDLYTLSTVKVLGFRVFPWIFFLPNLHFWSSGIGKDSLLFLAVAFFFYSFKDIKKRWGYMLFAVLISLFFRPHILVFLMASAGAGAFLDSSMKAYQRILIMTVFSIGFLLMYDFFLNFLNLESLDAASIESFASDRQASLSTDRTGSAVDVSNYPLILKVFTFLYRPLFFDMSGILAIFASLENLFLLIFTIKIFRSQPIKVFKKSKVILKSMVMFLIIGSIGFSMILGNLGIMLRQKTPFIMMLIIFGFWALSLKQAKKEGVDIIR